MNDHNGGSGSRAANQPQSSIPSRKARKLSLISNQSTGVSTLNGAALQSATQSGKTPVLIDSSVVTLRAQTIGMLDASEKHILAPTDNCLGSPYYRAGAFVLTGRHENLCLESSRSGGRKYPNAAPLITYSIRGHLSSRCCPGFQLHSGLNAETQSTSDWPRGN